MQRLKAFLSALSTTAHPNVSIAAYAPEQRPLPSDAVYHCHLMNTELSVLGEGGVYVTANARGPDR